MNLRQRALNIKLNSLPLVAVEPVVTLIVVMLVEVVEPVVWLTITASWLQMVMLTLSISAVEH
jgi:hypothetical protein